LVVESFILAIQLLACARASIFGPMLFNTMPENRSSRRATGIESNMTVVGGNPLHMAAKDCST
jgi:hypothetical protein